MRKSNLWMPIIITAAFIAVIVGVFLYRQHGGSPTVSLSQIQSATGTDVAFIDGKININTAANAPRPTTNVCGSLFKIILTIIIVSRQ